MQECEEGGVTVKEVLCHRKKATKLTHGYGDQLTECHGRNTGSAGGVPQGKVTVEERRRDVGFVLPRYLAIN